MSNCNPIVALFLFTAGIVLYSVRADSPDCKRIISTMDIRASPLSCTFNNNTCGFAVSQGWSRTNSYSYQNNDIRNGLENSQFIVFDRSRSSTRSSSISTPELRPGTYCLSLWTYTTGIAGSLQIKTSSGKNVTVIKGRIKSGWIQHIATVNGATPFQIEFQYILSSFLSSYVTIGIDNILIVQTAGFGSNKTEMSCAPGEASSTNGTCNFNSGSCGYTIQGHFEMKTGLYSYAGNVIQQGHENSPYIVCNWKKIDVTNNNTLMSPLIKPGTYCLTFWYYVTGSSVGLSVFTTTGQSLFSNISDPESTHVWTQVAVSVTENRPFKVLFQMLRAKGFFTQLQTVGIDDIRVSSRREKVCSEIVPEGTCTFKDSQSCGFKLDPKRWKVNRGEFSVGRPVFRHGQDDEYYALFETYNRIGKEVDGQAYDIASPLLNPGYYCLSFWYQLPNHYSNISVIVSDEVANNTMWSLEQSQKNWTEKSLRVDSKYKFKILFRSYRFSQHVGAFVGLDNIKLSKEPDARIVSSTKSLSSTLSSKSPFTSNNASMFTPSMRTIETTASTTPTSTIVSRTASHRTIQIETTTSHKTKQTHTTVSKGASTTVSSVSKTMTLSTPSFSSTAKKPETSVLPVVTSTRPHLRTIETTTSIPPTNTIVSRTTSPRPIQIKTTTSPETKQTHTTTTLIPSTIKTTNKITTFSITTKKTYSTNKAKTSASKAPAKQTTLSSTKTTLSKGATTTVSSFSSLTSTNGQRETSTEEHIKPNIKTSTSKTEKKNTHKTTKFPSTTPIITTPMASMKTSSSMILTSLTSERKKVSTKSPKTTSSTTHVPMTTETPVNPTTSIEMKNKTTPIRSTMMKTKTTQEPSNTSTSSSGTSASSKIPTITDNATTTPSSVTTTDTTLSSKIRSSTTVFTPTSPVVTMVSKTRKQSTVLLSTSEKHKTSQTSQTMSSALPTETVASSASPSMTTVSKKMTPLTPSTSFSSTAKNPKTRSTARKLSTSILPIVTPTRSYSQSSTTHSPFVMTSTSQKPDAASTTTLNLSTTSVVNRTSSSAVTSKWKTLPSISSKGSISTSPLATTSNTEPISSEVTSEMTVVSTKSTSAIPFHNTTSERTVNHSNLSSSTYFESTTISQAVNHSVTSEFPHHIETSVTTEKNAVTSNVSTSISIMSTATEDFSSSSAELLTSTILKSTRTSMPSSSAFSFSSGKSTLSTNSSKSASPVTKAKTDIAKTTPKFVNSTDSTQVGQQNTQKGGGSKIGTIVGSVLGVFAAIGLIVLVLFLYLKLKSKRLSNNTPVIDDETEPTFDKSSRNSNNLGLQPLGGQSLNQQYASIVMQPENGHTDNVRDSNRSFTNIIYDYDNTNA